jgi:hypothetical protein
MPVADYRTAKYRKWNRERMARYRKGPYGIKEYTTRRARDLREQRVRIVEQLRDLEKET